MTNSTDKNPSLFDQLAVAMDLDGLDGNHTPLVQECAASLRRVVLPQLQLPAQRRKPALTWNRSMLLPLAASVAVMIGGYQLLNRHTADGTLRVKGGTTVHLFWERAGAVSEFTPKTSLTNGDRVLAEVMTPGRAEAFWGVTNANGDVLGSWDDVRASRMTLSPAKRLTFPTSLQLVGHNDKEVLFVLVCTPEVPDPFKDLTKLKDVYLNDIKNCSIWRFQLR